MHYIFFLTLLWCCNIISLQHSSCWITIWRYIYGKVVKLQSHSTPTGTKRRSAPWRLSYSTAKVSLDSGKRYKGAQMLFRSLLFLFCKLFLVFCVQREIPDGLPWRTLLMKGQNLSPILIYSLRGRWDWHREYRWVRTNHILYMSECLYDLHLNLI